MKKLSTAFKVVGTLALISAVLCGAIFAGDAKSGAFLVFVCWAGGGALFFMFALAQALLLDAVSDIKDRVVPPEMEEDTDWHPPVRQADAQPKPAHYTAATPVIPDPAQRIKATKAPPRDGFVFCPNCGREQAEYFATGERRTTCCDCGSTLPEPGSTPEQTDGPVKPITYDWCDGDIICPRCNQKQRKNRTVCYRCGAQFVTPEAEDQD